MEKKTAAQEFLDSKISRDKETIRRSQAVSMMVQYSSLQSEEKDKEIDNLQRIIKEEREIRQRHEVTLSKMLAKQRDEIERLREALSALIEKCLRTADTTLMFQELCDAQQALSNQPIESDKDRRLMKTLQEKVYETYNELYNKTVPGSPFPNYPDAWVEQIALEHARELSEAKDRRIKELEEELQLLNSRLMPKDAFKDIK